MNHGGDQRNTGPSNFVKSEDLSRPGYVNPTGQQNQGFGGGNQQSGFGNNRQQGQGFGNNGQQSGFNGGNQRYGGNQQGQGFNGNQRYGGNQQTQRFGNNGQQGQGFGGNQQGQGFNGNQRFGNNQQVQGFNGNQRGSYRGGYGGRQNFNQAYQGTGGRKPKVKKLSKCQKKYRCGPYSGPGESQRIKVQPDDFANQWTSKEPYKKIVFPPLSAKAKEFFDSMCKLHGYVQEAASDLAPVAEVPENVEEAASNLAPVAEVPIAEVPKKVELAVPDSSPKYSSKRIVLTSVNKMISVNFEVLDGMTRLVLTSDSEIGVEL